MGNGFIINGLSWPSLKRQVSKCGMIMNQMGSLLMDVHRDILAERYKCPEGNNSEVVSEVS